MAVFVYKLNGKWRLSPNYEQERAWLFTKDSTLTDDSIWYTFGTNDVPNSDEKKKVRIATDFKVRGLKNTAGNRIYDEICKPPFIYIP